MTSQELKKLNRQDLLRLLLETEKENRRLRSLLADARSQLENRRLAVSEAGNLAEAALRLSGVFEDAQRAADIYLQNAEQVCREQESKARELAEERVRQSEDLVAAAEQKCREMERDCQARCDSLTEETERRAAAYEENVRRRILAYLREHPELRRALE